MKILLVCAGGMSTGILMKKMQEYWAEQGIELEIDAVGVGEVEDTCQKYDIILCGPQISYRMNEIKEESGLPVASIPPTDYALHNCANIMKLAQDLYAQK